MSRPGHTDAELLVMGHRFAADRDAGMRITMIARREHLHFDTVVKALATIGYQLPERPPPLVASLLDRKKTRRPDWSYPDKDLIRLAHAGRAEIAKADRIAVAQERLRDEMEKN